MSDQHKINVFFGTVIAICILAMTSQDLVTYAKAFFLSVIIGCLCIMRGLRDGVKKNHDSPSEETKEENQDRVKKLSAVRALTIRSQAVPWNNG